MPILLAVIVYFLTQDEPKTYSSSTTIYTGIASGSSIVSLEDTRTDLFGTRTAFDNLISIIESKKTAEEVGLKLFTSHILLKKPDSKIISTENYTKLMHIVPQDVKKLAVANNSNQTYKNILAYKNKDYENFVYELIHLNHPHYSADKILSKLKASRLQTSDLIELRYQADDPGICYHTLKLINDIFIDTYARMKLNQSDAVVNYFQGQLDDANKKLDEAEGELLEFNKTNNIMNYYEQTKHIASEKENFEMEYLRIKMDYAAAGSVLRMLEDKLGSNQIRLLKSKKIMDLREQLSEVNMEVAEKTQLAQFDNTNEDDLITEISALRLKAFELQEQMKDAVEQKYSIENSSEGLTTTSILNDWLSKTIEFEGKKAQLIIGEQRKEEFNNLYSRYAPLGANMKRLERKINVAEREYLSILQSLNLAKLKQQNIELNTNLKVAEQPFFPIKPAPGKRKYLIIIAFMIGFIIPLFLILALEFLDPNIKTVIRAEKFSRLKVASVFPNFNLKRKKIDWDYARSRSAERIIQKILLIKNKTIQKEVIKIAFLSNLKGEGKTTIIQAVGEKMKQLGLNFQIEDSENINTIISIENLTKNDRENKTDFLLIEVPDLKNHLIPIALIKEVDQLYIVTRSNRIWKKSDDEIIRDLKSINNKCKPKLLLNGVDKEELETLFGDISEKRSLVRRWIKNCLYLRFFIS